MNLESKVVFCVLGGNGWIYIYRTTSDEEPKFIIIHHEFEVNFEICDHAPEVHKKIEYSSFEDAFTYLSDFHWPIYYIFKLKKQYKGFVLEKLIEKLNNEFSTYHPYSQKDFKEKGILSTQKVLSASIFQNSAGSWSYSVK